MKNKFPKKRIVGLVVKIAAEISSLSKGLDNAQKQA